MIKIFIGPMTKNVVDAVMEFSKDTDNPIGFIPSRRQVENTGGYVNNWKTKEFSKYTKGMFLTRDHAGPSQGLYEDDGFDSLKTDCRYFDMIHVDPWKKYPDLHEGIAQTIKMIRYCLKQNPDMAFEVGTEESIRRFDTKEIDFLLKSLKTSLSKEEFKKITHCVIQSGTSLRGNYNTGVYDKDRLIEMVDVTDSYNLISKEHNGDYLPANLIKEKFSLGLGCINIAPEFGQIETKAYVQAIKQSRPDLIDKYWDICYNSGKWKKWVDNSFKPAEKKEELINICGHYVISQPIFIEHIRNNLDGIDDIIKDKIKIKLKELFDG